MTLAMTTSGSSNHNDINTCLPVISTWTHATIARYVGECLFWWCSFHLQGKAKQISRLGLIPAIIRSSFHHYCSSTLSIFQQTACCHLIRYVDQIDSCTCEISFVPSLLGLRREDDPMIAVHAGPVTWYLLIGPSWICTKLRVVCRKCM